MLAELSAQCMASRSSSSVTLPGFGLTMADCTGNSCIDGIFSSEE